jgi:carboxylesterase
LPQPGYLDPGAYAADVPASGEQSGQRVGVLLIHGYTGSVAETRPMGEYLAARGLAIRCPLLPGHGTTPEALTRIRLRDWTAEVEAALDELQRRCDSVFVGGLSLGSLLTLWLGARHADLAGLIAMSPAIKLQTRLLPLTLGLRLLLKYNPFGGLGGDNPGDPAAAGRNWCYDETPLWGAGEVYLLQRKVLRALASIHQPLLVFQGRRDSQMDPRAPEILYNRVGSTDKRVIWLENSGHNLLVDGERESVWAQSFAWIMQHANAAQAGAQMRPGSEGANR